MSACPECRASSLITCRITHRTDQASRSFGNHGMSCGTGTPASRSAVVHQMQRRGVLRPRTSLSSPSSVSSSPHHVLLGEVPGDLVERPGVPRRKVRGGGDPRHPAALHTGDVLDQPADRQCADRRPRAGLLVGQAVGHREERALVVGEVFAQCAAFVGDGRGESGHRRSFRSTCSEAFHACVTSDGRRVRECR